jgi:hypothetical protein
MPLLLRQEYPQKVLPSLMPWLASRKGQDAALASYEAEVKQLAAQSNALSESLSFIEKRVTGFFESYQAGKGALPGPASVSTPSSPHAALSATEATPAVPPSASVVAQGSKTGYVFWSSDFHISPIADLKDLLEPMGMTIIDKSLSGHCHLKKTCAKDLKVRTLARLESHDQPM